MQRGQVGQTGKEAHHKSHARVLTDADSVKTSQAQISWPLSPAVGKASFLPLFASGNGNLPGVYRGVDWKDFEASDQDERMLSPTLGAKLKGVRVGDVLSAVIEDEIEVWPGVTSPVRALVAVLTVRDCVGSGRRSTRHARKS